MMAYQAGSPRDRAFRQECLAPQAWVLKQCSTNKTPGSAPINDVYAESTGPLTGEAPLAILVGVVAG